MVHLQINLILSPLNQLAKPLIDYLDENGNVRIGAASSSLPAKW